MSSICRGERAKRIGGAVRDGDVEPRLGVGAPHWSFRCEIPVARGECCQQKQGGGRSGRREGSIAGARVVRDSHSRFAVEILTPALSARRLERIRTSLWKADSSLDGSSTSSRHTQTARRLRQ
jgi:hypothetical protein